MKDRRDLQEEPESTLGAKPTEHEGVQPRPRIEPTPERRPGEHPGGSRLRHEEGEETEDGREIREFEETRGWNSVPPPAPSPTPEEE